MGLHLGDTAPDFTAMTTDGEVSFHEWKKDSWAVFFSHPADFTPVCTTELGRTAALKDGFAKRNTKVMALSIDPIEEHHKCAPDIGESPAPHSTSADPDHRIAELYDMIQPGEGDTSTVRSVFIVDPADKLRLMLTYPKSVGRNFDGIVRVIDALQATDKDPIATPADWKPGERVIVSMAVSTEEAKKKFDNVEEFKPYLRYADAPKQAGKRAQVTLRSKAEQRCREVPPLTRGLHGIAVPEQHADRAVLPTPDDAPGWAADCIDKVRANHRRSTTRNSAPSTAPER